MAMIPSERTRSTLTISVVPSIAEWESGLGLVAVHVVTTANLEVGPLGDIVSGAPYARGISAQKVGSVQRSVIADAGQDDEPEQQCCSGQEDPC